MTARKKPEPVLIHVTYTAGPVTMEVDVPALKVSATIDAMVKVHQRAVQRHPELIPELSPVTSSMVIPVEEDEDYDGRVRRKRVGF